MPQVEWPSFTLVLTSDRPQDIYRRPSVIQVVPAVMEPTAPPSLMKTIDHRWKPIPSDFGQSYASDEVFAYTLGNDSATRTYVGQTDDDDDARTIHEEERRTTRRGRLSMGRKLSSKSLRVPLPKSWNKDSFFRILQKISLLDECRQFGLRTH